MRLVPFAYLGSYLLSLLGNSIAAVALPLIVLQATGSVLGAGTVAAATAVPALLAGLLMGVVIDRVNRRTSSVVTDLVSAASIAALPIVDALTGLNLGWFVLLGVIGSFGDIPGMTAREALLPAVVRAGGISVERMIGLREGVGAVALLVGPAAAGILLSVFDGSTVLWITAGTSAAAALVTLLIPHRVGRVTVTATTGTTSMATELRAGWRGLVGSRFLLATTAVGTLSIVALGALQGLILPVHFTLIGEPAMLGFVLTGVAAGLLVGAGLYVAVGPRLSRRVWFVSSILGTTVGLGVLAALPPTWAILGGAVLLGIASSAMNGVLGVLMLERIPEELRGRIMSLQNALVTVAAPVGLFVAALVTEFAALWIAGLVVAGAWLVAAAIALAARSLRTLDETTEGGMADAQQ